MRGDEQFRPLGDKVRFVADPKSYDLIVR